MALLTACKTCGLTALPGSGTAFVCPAMTQSRPRMRRTISGWNSVARTGVGITGSPRLNAPAARGLARGPGELRTRWVL
jgi:hypothetical protein